MVDVIHHIRYVGKLAKQFHDHLNSGGVVAIVTKSQEQVNANHLKAYFPLLTDININGRYHWYRPIRQLICQFKSAGFKHVETIPFQENASRYLTQSEVDRIKSKCISDFVLMPDAALDSGIKKLTKALKDTQSNTIECTYAGKTILVFSKK